MKQYLDLYKVWSTMLVILGTCTCGVWMLENQLNYVRVNEIIRSKN